MFAPLQELENAACGTWYVNALAVRPEHRNQGHEAHLLTIAEHLSREAGLTSLSLIVSDANIPARRLYESFGFNFVAARTMVKEGWDNPGIEWHLMLRKDCARWSPTAKSERKSPAY